MKKVFIIFASILLMVSLVVPVFATENGYYVIDDYPFDGIAEGAVTSFQSDIIAIETGETFISWAVNNYSHDVVYQSPEGPRRVYFPDSGWVTGYNIIKPVDSFNDGEKAWLAINATFVPASCDGSTCPATDVNLDDICDDCGATFSMLRNFTPNDFPSGYPSVPSVSSDARYYLYRVHGSGSIYIVVYPSAVTPTYDTTKQNGYLTFSESYGSYRLDTSTNEWIQNNDDSPYSIGGTNNNSVDILYSSVDIKDQNGDLFFPIPLWMEMEQVTQGEMSNLTTTTAGTMKILVLCGVGLIALLAVLSLFGKVLKIFHR